ncbi:Nucleic acid-binding OB-fold [Arabidopsis thaliana x Arabidopsis arenosa]|uniref:Nucleic acid-binding OB-fold n=1 Tax=Arabidopsis thaliana x Arabidopsis arenosa TaxID=1240361 RepID=A0A8T2E0S4_9BRAS|nr:Nucleic acid-binding OB-fold [Arabidopsis thaliana x Arabidopsis arenosa]
MEFVRDGTYVRLNGHLKTFQGEKQLLVFSVRPIMDFNEVTFHYIECIHFYSQNSESQDNKSVMLLSRLTPHFKVDQTQSNTIEPPLGFDNLRTYLSGQVTIVELALKTLIDVVPLV